MSFTQAVDLRNQKNEDEMPNIAENHCNLRHPVIIVLDEVDHFVDRHHGHHRANLDVHPDLRHHLYSYYDYHHLLHLDHHVLLK